MLQGSGSEGGHGDHPSHEDSISFHTSFLFCTGNYNQLILSAGMPEPRVLRVQVHTLPFAFSTLWVQCGCKLGVQPVNKTFTTDRINRPSRMCVGVFHPVA
jgi:hypothetical protein